MRLKNAMLFLPLLCSSLLPAQSTDLSTTVLKLTREIREAVDRDDLDKALDPYVELRVSIQAELDKRKPAPAEKLIQLEADYGIKTSGIERVLALLGLPQAAYDAGEYYKAEKYATLLLDSTDQPGNNPSRADAIMEGNTIKGRLLLQDKDLAGAKAALTASISAAGESGLIRSFGPKMELVQDLLNAGEREAVIQFLSSCKPFWRFHRGTLDLWIAAIRGGGNPVLKR